MPQVSSVCLLYFEENHSAELSFLVQTPQLKAWGQVNLFLSVFPTHFTVLVEYTAEVGSFLTPIFHCLLLIGD